MFFDDPHEYSSLGAFFSFGAKLPLGPDALPWLKFKDKQNLYIILQNNIVTSTN